MLKSRTRSAISWGPFAKINPRIKPCRQVDEVPANRTHSVGLAFQKMRQTCLQLPILSHCTEEFISSNPKHLLILASPHAEDKDEKSMDIIL